MALSSPLFPLFHCFFAVQTLFYVTLAPFFAFYSLFAFVLYPLRHLLHPLHWQVPVGGLAFPVNLLRHWTFSLYYVVSDLWGSAGIPLLFWSCANDLVSLEQVGEASSSDGLH